MTGVIWIWEVAPTVCSCHMERVTRPPGADTRTIEGHSDSTTGAPLKPFAFSGFQINIVFFWEREDSPGGVEGGQLRL